MREYRYNNQDARYAKVNRVFLLGALLLFLVLVLYVHLDADNIRLPRAAILGNDLAILLFAILNGVLFGLNQSTGLLRILITAEISLEFILLSMTSPATFLGMALVGVLGISLAYYDKKFYTILFLYSSVLYVGCQVLRGVLGFMPPSANGLCLTIIILAIFIMLMRIGSITKLFSDDSLGALAEQKALQEQMMGEILDISQIVKDEADKSREMVARLVESALHSALNIQDISQTTDTTARNLETQTAMTRDIQSSIVRTKSHSGQMVTIASDSNQQIQENQVMMTQLKERAAQISQTNAQVTSSMEKLQDKTRAVDSFASTILSIAEQTNLLSLNASIESARAGEAGKGFAVVAKQIRQLAEETRGSAENITTIANELTANSQEVVEVVHISVEAAEEQNSMILDTAAAFEQLGRNMAQLAESIQVIDQAIDDLSDVNQTMVASISEISASTQEISASADDTNTITQENLNYAKRTSSALTSIQKTAARLDKYHGAH